jgi:hypothetical protein
MVSPLVDLAVHRFACNHLPSCCRPVSTLSLLCVNECFFGLFRVLGQTIVIYTPSSFHGTLRQDLFLSFGLLLYFVTRPLRHTTLDSRSVSSPQSLSLITAISSRISCPFVHAHPLFFVRPACCVRFDLHLTYTPLGALRFIFM